MTALPTHPVPDATDVKTEYAGSIDSEAAPRPLPNPKLRALVLLLARAAAREGVSLSSSRNRLSGEPWSDHSRPTPHPAGSS
jgi:hypothetical protein